jgi:O-antigen/teichoic acid export membrane protein
VSENRFASARRPLRGRRAPATNGYGRGARILSVGIATTGLVTFAYFALASHSLDEVDYKGISVLWSALFLIISIIYRPVEQLLSHTISSRRAQGHEGHPLRVPLIIQASTATLFLVAALALREPIQDDVFDGSAELYWVLVVAVLAYAASYFARGWLAGHQRFGLYGGLVLLESCSRCLFAVAVAIGIAEGQGAVALGIAAAPLVSLLVVPWAIEHRGGGAGERGSMREGAGFAGAVLAIMVAEQALLNGPVLAVDATAADAALAGFVFNVLLITRAPLQLFQAIQTSLLPHLSGLAATGGGTGGVEFKHAIRVTVLAIAGFTTLVVLALGLVGPWAMGVLFGGDFDYARGGLVLVGLGMGFHLTAGTLNQAALARRRGAQAATAWLASALLFMGWLVLAPLDDHVLAVELGYCATTALLAAALWAIEAGAAVPGASAATAASRPSGRSAQSPTAGDAPSAASTDTRRSG